MSRFVLFFLLSSLFSVSFATSLTEDKIPEPLKPWANWVLEDEKQFQCPFFYNNFQQKRCSWSGKLSLELKSKQAQFSSQWQVFNDDWITLPGNTDYWPQNVTVNNKAALVMNRHGKPSIRLTKGKYKIIGDFFWDRIPESLVIPKNTGLFSLKINDKSIPFPIVKGHSIWLKTSDIKNTKPKSVENKLDLQIFRKVYDDVPLQLISFFELEVSGEQREIRLPYALLKDFIPVTLKSPLPARIEPNGSLLIQARQGRWHIELQARHPQYLTQLSLKIKDKQWPNSEIWSFQSQPFQRIVEIEQLKSIDPSQSNVPRQWKNLPSYQVKQGDSMVFKVIRRGDPEPNQLTLKRQLWLDFDGDAYTVSDSIHGKMTQGWRLNALTETQLGQVKVNGRSQLITTAISSNKQGIELRQGNISMQADSRIKGDINNISATGWQQDFHQVQAELNIPPGWRLLAANGVDNVPESWISQWTLLDLFLVLIAALTINQMWSLSWGIFALLTLILCWHEPGAPHFIWLNILAAIALIRVLPSNNFQKSIKWYRNFCWLTLLVIMIPFMISQVRMGLYPQLEKQWHNISQTLNARKNQTMDRVELEMDQIRAKPSVSSISSHKKSMGRVLSMAPEKIIKKRSLNNRIDPDANIQTGPGLPQWQWKKVQLSWNGAVDEQQQINFWYLSPTQSMLLNFLRVLLLIILSLLMLGMVNKKFKFTQPIFSWVLLIPLLSLPVQDVQANFPQQQLLDELKSRLLQAPDCLPICAQIPLMKLNISAKKLNISLQIHAQQEVAIPLPAKSNLWLPNQVLVDGHQAQTLIRTNNGTLWLSLKKGQHQVELSGLTPAHNKLTLPLQLKPLHTKVITKGWSIEGLHNNGRTDSQLIISRVRTIQQLQASKQTLEPGILPAFIRVERTLHLGLDWHITTRVIRVVNNHAPLAIKLPLLDGESVTTNNIRVKNRQVLINLSPRQTNLQWQSILKKSATIDLIAAETHQWTEVWRADVSPIWHIQGTGITAVHHQDKGQWLPEWRPWPAEKLSLNISRPVAVKGATLTIDRTDLQVKPGKRSIETKLTLAIRSSKAVQHTLTLPDDIQLQSVKINGISQPIRLQKSNVTLPIKPGKQHITLNWKKTQEQSTLLTTPTIDLGVVSVNNHFNINLGHDRWVLFTAGPKFGPAVLFWGMLIVLTALAFGLGKVPITPLKHWHWFLLLIGLSQLAVQSALIIVIWLMALGFRDKKQPEKSIYFNASQIGLGLLTLTSLILLFIAVQQGLLGSPDMQIVGNQSSAFNLNWYQDRSNALLPTATVISVPLMTYRILMLLWSLWLAVSLLHWLKWGWGCFSSNGLWKAKKESITNKKEDLV